MSKMWMMALALSVSGCGAKQPGLTALDFRVMLKKELAIAGAENTTEGMRSVTGYDGTPVHPAKTVMWEVEFEADPATATEAFEAYRERVAGVVEKHPPTGSQRGGSNDFQQFLYLYGPTSKQALLHCMLVKRPQREWTVVQLIHEP